ncbi:NmrA family NAD(P)-binding protein [Rhodococcus sp. NPDC056960]
MKLAVIGGTGLIGPRVVRKMAGAGHDTVALFRGIVEECTRRGSC